MQFIRVISGDHERTALDFQKHYRHSNILYLMDPDRTFERAHNRDGWPFLLLVDPNGTVVRKVNNLVDGDPEMLQALKRMRVTADAAPLQKVDGVRYASATLRRSGESDRPQAREQYSHLAATADGRVFLVFTARRDRSSDVWLRVWDGKAWSADRAVAGTEADEYDGTVVTAADNRVWFCWTSNAGGDRYNIFVTNLERLTGGEKAIQVTDSDDDAMGGRMAMDAGGTLWITYYQWQKNRQGISRDKEIFVRTLRGETLSREVQVSPTDVPDYEDHTDPALVPLGNKMLIAWSWDYHRPRNYPPEPESPTIFLRAVDGNLQLAKPYYASGTTIDMVPVLASQGDGAWCFWDSLNSGGRTAGKSLQFRRVGDAGCTGRIASLVTGLEHICSPCVAVGPQERTVLVWCQKRRDGNWELWHAECDARGQFSEPEALVTTGNPRYSSATFDAGGTLWVSYTRDAVSGRVVAVERH